MKIVKFLCLMVLAVGAMNALADELDPAFQTPQGVIVRETENGIKEVFKANINEVTSEVAAENAVKDFVKPENAVAKVTPGNELDHTSSDEQWHRWVSAFLYGSSYSPHYYSYGYQSVTHYYYPSYQWHRGGYSYSYYSHSYYQPRYYYHHHHHGW